MQDVLTIPRPTSHPELAASHAEIAVEAARRLRQCAGLEGRPVRCRVHAGILRLSGCVANFYQKQLAQTVVCGIPGVSRVVNDINVGVN